MKGAGRKIERGGHAFYAQFRLTCVLGNASPHRPDQVVWILKFVQQRRRLEFHHVEQRCVGLPQRKIEHHQGNSHAYIGLPKTDRATEEFVIRPGVCWHRMPKTYFLSQDFLARRIAQDLELGSKGGFICDRIDLVIVGWPLQQE